MRLSVDTFYCDKEAGRLIYFTYVDGRRVFLSAVWALREVARGTARMVTL